MTVAPVAVLFEVMDKEWPLWMVVVVSVAIGTAGFYLCRRRSWLSIPIFALAFLNAWGQISELRDPYVGPAILKEASSVYLILSYLSVAIAIVLPLIGLLGRRNVEAHG